MSTERPPWEETWRIGDDKNDIFTGDEFDPNMEIVCYGAPIPRNYLIAAAPDLYRALEQFISAGQMYNEPDDWSPSSVDFDVCLRDARAALAKARGSKP